jgi:hypothetical protein
MKTLLAMIAIVAALVTAAPARAAVFGAMGNNWLDSCESKQEPDQTWCAAYAFGVAAGAGLVSSNAFCPNGLPDPRQYIDIAMAYIRRHPEMRREIVSGLMLLAWAEAWPSHKN